MKLLVPCSCHHCGKHIQAPQMLVGKMTPCPHCGRSFRVEFSLEAEAPLLPQTIHARQLEFTCAMNNKTFTSVFRWVPTARKYQLWETEHGTGTLDRGAYGHAARAGKVIVIQEPDQAVFAYADFDFSQWSCVWCGQKNYNCCNLGHLFCKARHHRNGYAVCPVCGDDGYYTESVTTVTGETATFQQPAPMIARAQAAGRTAIAAVPTQPKSQPAPRLAERIQRLLLPGGSWKG